MRTLLATDTDFYCNPAGNDITGDGSIGNPWKSPMGAYDHLASMYDLGGKRVRVLLADGTYTQTNQFEGPLVGQRGASGLQFIGNRANPAAVLMRPSTGYAFSVGQGAQALFAGFKTYMLDSDGAGMPGSGQDALAVGALSLMVLDGDIHFGANVNPWNCISIPGGQLNVRSGPVGTPKRYTIAPGLITTSWTAGVGFPNWITVPVGIVPQLRLFMGVNGPHMSANPSCHVVGLDPVGNRVQLSTPAGGGAPGQSVNFSYGMQVFCHVGEGGSAQFETNGEPGRMTIEWQHLPHVHAAGFYASQGSQIDMQGIAWVGHFHGKRFDVRSSSTIDVNGGVIANPLDYIPGTIPGTVASGGQYV